jgi:PKD repeat protein
LYPAIYGDRVVWRYAMESDIYVGIVLENESKLVLLIANFSTNVTSGYAFLQMQVTDLETETILG